MVWAISLIGAFYLFTSGPGCGAAAIVGPDKILPRRAGRTPPPLLALELGGTILLGVISVVAFCDDLAVVAGLAITASASFAHDIYASVNQAGLLQQRGTGPRLADHRRRPGYPRYRAGILATAAQRLPGGPGVRRRRVGEPADDPVLAAVIGGPTPCALWSMRLAASAIVLSRLPGGVGRKTSMIPGGLPLVPRCRTRARLDPAGISCSASSGTPRSSGAATRTVNAEMEEISPGRCRWRGGAQRGSKAGGTEVGTVKRMALDLRADLAVLRGAHRHPQRVARRGRYRRRCRGPPARADRRVRGEPRRQPRAGLTDLWPGAPRPPCRTPRHRAHRRQRAAPLGERPGGTSSTAVAAWT